MINSNLVNDIQPRGSEDVYISQTYIKFKIMDYHIVIVLSYLNKLLFSQF